MINQQSKIVTIVGAGLIGSAWSIVFARAGYKVNIYDPNASIRNGYHTWAKKALSDLRDYGLLENPEETLSLLRIFENLEKSLDGSIYIQESVYETIESKTAISKQIDSLMSSEMIVGSSSSGIPASLFTEECNNRDRFLISHPVNPPHLVPVVELVPAPWTDPKVLEQTKILMNDIGQKPVVLSREMDGFILNRLQGALLNEAWALYEEGLASAADIDATVKHGLGLRWAFMGPFETIDLNAPEGIVDYSERLSDMYFSMGNSRLDHPWPKKYIDKANDELRADFPKDSLLNKRVWRDQILMSLAGFKRNNKLD